MTTNDATTDAPDETMSLETFGLIGALMTQSQANLSATQDQLHASALRDVVRLSEALVRISWILDEATVIDRKTESRLNSVHAIWGAEQTLDHARRMLTRVTGEYHGEAIG